MTNTITLDARLFAATLFARSFDSTRYYLQSVQIERIDSGFITVCTSGTVLTAAKHNTGCKYIGESVLLDLDNAKDLLSALRDRKAALIRLEPTENRFKYSTLNENGGVLSEGFVPRCDGMFPDWRRAVKLATENTVPDSVPYSGNEWAVILDTAKRIGTPKKPNPFRLFGTNPLLIRYADDSVYSVMTPANAKIAQCDGVLPF